MVRWQLAEPLFAALVGSGRQLHDAAAGMYVLHGSQLGCGEDLWLEHFFAYNRLVCWVRACVAGNWINEQEGSLLHQSLCPNIGAGAVIEPKTCCACGFGVYLPMSQLYLAAQWIVP